jgi:transcription antitermination factor NusG
MLGVILDEHSGWLVVVVESGRDHIAEKNLRRAGWRCYFPVYRKQLAHKITEDGRRVGAWKGRGDIVFRPLFSGYGFVAWDETVQWRSMKDAVGVLGFLLNGERPAVVPERGRPPFVDSSGKLHPATWGVEDVREIVDAGLLDEAREAKEVRTDIVPGNIVKLTTGPLSALLGRLENIDDHNRARVLIQMLGGRETLVRDIDADSLRLMAAQ